jgi:hypothetical protein
VSIPPPVGNRQGDSISRLLLNLARSFNELVRTFDFSSLNEEQQEALREVRQNIAFALLVHDQTIGMEELMPEKHLIELP